jgi:polysaccharide export outer membrane protein
MAARKVDVLPAPTDVDTQLTGRPYLVGPFDKLEIDVFGIPELSRREVQTDARAQLQFPLAGTIDASGKTPAEVSAMIADRLRAQHVRDPQVTTNLKEAVSRVVTVDGEVREPGVYPVVGHMTLMRSVALAKGLTEFSRSEYVVVFRTLSSQRYAALYNLQAIREGYYDDPEIFPDDVVIVSESRARRIFKDVLQAAPAIVTPLVYILR